MPSREDRSAGPSPEPAAGESAAAEPAAPSAAPPPADPPQRVTGRFTPDKLSAYAAVAGVVIAGISLYVGSRDDQPPSPPDQTTLAQSAGSLGPVVVVAEPDAITASGTYEGLDKGETVVFMVQPADDDSKEDPWITLFAQRTATETVDGKESGRWRTTMPVSDPRQAWRHFAAIGTELALGVNEPEVLDRLAEEGPESPLLTGLTDVSVSGPQQ